MKITYLALTLTLVLVACSGDRGGTVGSESHWLPCAKSDDCESSYVCARGQCRPQDDVSWVAECDGAIEICDVVGSAPVRDPEVETGDWELGRGGVARPQQAGTCLVGESTYFDRTGRTIEYGDNGKPLRRTWSAGDATEYEYGAHGFVTRERRVAEGSTIAETKFERDVVGRLVHYTYFDERWGRSERAYRYDALGRIKRVDAEYLNGHSWGTDVIWSDDGFTHTEHTQECGTQGTVTRDGEGYIVRRDWPDCEAFGNPIREYDRDGEKFVAIVSIGRETGERSVIGDATYHPDGRLRSISNGIDRAEGGDDEGTTTQIEWEDGWMTRLVVTRILSGRLVDTVELTGDCWFTMDEVRNWTPYGVVLSP